MTRIGIAVIGIALSVALADVVVPGAKLEKIAGDCAFTEGPAADADGSLYFSDSPNKRIMVVRPDGKVEVFKNDSGRANGMAFDAQGRLVACCAQGAGGARAVVRWEKNGSRTVLAESFEGKRFNAPNDLTLDDKGRIYFTDPAYGSRPSDGQPKFSIYRIDAEKSEAAAGKVSRVIDDVDTPNGIAISPDYKTLYVADNSARKDGPHTLLAYDIAADGACKRRGILHDFKDHRGIDGMRVDTDGNVWATAESGKLTGVYVFAPDGKQIGFIQTPETATNCTFGGADLKTLYITAGTSVYKVRVNAAGFLAWPKPGK
jgi:gluconolactonase